MFGGLENRQKVFANLLDEIQAATVVCTVATLLLDYSVTVVGCNGRKSRPFMTGVTGSWAESRGFG
jgi:hypothetical protein